MKIKEKDEKMEIAFVIFGLIFVLMGVICIFDARKITTKWFSFQDINEGAKYLKIFGFSIAMLGCGMIYIYMPEIVELVKK